MHAGKTIGIKMPKLYTKSINILHTYLTIEIQQKVISKFYSFSDKKRRIIHCMYIVQCMYIMQNVGTMPGHHTNMYRTND